jgi:hypothetical protein
MCSSHQPDMGWVFRVDNKVSHQLDGFNCGVFLLGYIVCFLFGMDPSKLSPVLIADYRICLFCDLFDEQVLVDPTRIVSYPPTPWARTTTGTPSLRIKLPILPPSPLLPENALRSTSNRVTLPSSRADMTPELFQRQAKAAQDLRTILANREQAKRQKLRKENKSKHDALQAEKHRLIKERADRELARKDADQKVDVILSDGLAAALEKKGRTHEKKLKALLDKHFFTIETPPVASPGLPEGDGKVGEGNLKVHPEHPPDTMEDQVAFLRFWQGTSQENPPSDEEPEEFLSGPKIGL